MIIWYVKKSFKKGISNYIKGNYIITANYRESWYRDYPVEEIGRFQAYWGARPCVVQLTQKQAEKWIQNVFDNSKKIKKIILKNKEH